MDTAQHFCPHAHCDYRGWVDWGKSRAHGPPSGGPGRQWSCRACARSFLETHGPPCHGQRVAPARLGWAVGALAQGLGIRAGARGVAVAATPGRAWWLEVADPLTAFSPYVLRAGRGTQVPRDALYALRRAGKDGAGSAAEARARLERSPQGGWVAMAPESQWLLARAVGERPLALAPRVVHQGVPGWAPGCVPRFLTAEGKA